MRRIRTAWVIGFLGAALVATLLHDGSAQAAGSTSRAEARIELGRRLFFDPAVSQSGRVSCASCHDPKHGYADAKRFSEDEEGLTARHSQPLLDGRFNPTAHRDGEFGSIEELVLARLGTNRQSSSGSSSYGGFFVPRNDDRGPVPVTPTAERPAIRDLQRTAKRLPRANVVPVRLERSKRYKEAFRAAFSNGDPTLPKIAQALADYCRSIESTRAPIDRFLAGDVHAISRSAYRGLALFRGRAGCAQCHTMDAHKDAGKPLFTNYDFHNTGVASVMRSTVDVKELLALSRRPERSHASNGRFLLTGHKDDMRAFKTPTLRDVAKRAPYMHDGSFRSLEEVVLYYASGCGNKPGLDKRIKKFDISEAELADLVAFLHTLSGEEQPGRARSAWSRRAKETKLRFRRDGKPVAGLRVVLEGVGDELPDSAARTRIERVTDKRGEVRFVPRGFTHVRVVEPGPEAGRPWPWIPDTCRTAQLDMVTGAPTEILLKAQGKVKLPDKIVAVERDGEAVVTFSRLPSHVVGDFVKSGWQKYRAWIHENARMTVRLRGQFITDDEFTDDPAKLLELLCQRINGPLELVLRPNGTHTLHMLSLNPLLGQDVKHLQLR